MTRAADSTMRFRGERKLSWSSVWTRRRGPRRASTFHEEMTAHETRFQMDLTNVTTTLILDTSAEMLTN